MHKSSRRALLSVKNSHSCGEPLKYKYSLVCWSPPSGYGIWIYCESTPSTFHFGSFFMSLGFTDGSAGKESTCSVRDLGLILGLGRFPGEGNRYPLQYSGLENSMNFIIHGIAKIRTWLSNFPGVSDGKASAYNAGDWDSIPRPGRSPGEGNGNPLQYSGLENPLDGGPGWLLSMGSQRVGHYCATSLKRLWEEVSSRHSLLCHFGWSLIPFSKANIYKAVTLIIMLMQFYYFCFSCFSFALVQPKILNVLFLNILYIYISVFLYNSEEHFHRVHRIFPLNPLEINIKSSVVFS